jgi:hypothetical protein
MSVLASMLALRALHLRTAPNGIVSAPELPAPARVDFVCFLRDPELASRDRGLLCVHPLVSHVRQLDTTQDGPCILRVTRFSVRSR